MPSCPRAVAGAAAVAEAAGGTGGVSRNTCGWPFRRPSPTIRPEVLIACAFVSVQPESLGIRVFRSAVPSAVGVHERMRRHAVCQREVADRRPVRDPGGVARATIRSCPDLSASRCCS